ncbi:MAG: tetratricopeptide repeat protein, partial [Alphaproteobacteria bacterium]
FLGLIEETKGNLKEAWALMEKSLEVNPNQPNVLNNLANLFNDIGENEKAVDLFKKALSIQRDYWDAWYNLGKVYFDMKRYDEAETALIKARDNWQSPEPRPHTLLGSLYQNRGDFDKANQNFLKALEVNPDYFNALHNYGLCLKSQLRCTEALSFYAKAMALKSNVPELFYNIANVHYELDDIEECFSYYRKAIELKPDFLEPHYALNELLWRQGREDEYLKSYQEAIQKMPDFLDLRLNFFEALLHTGQIPEATAAVSEIFKNCEVDARAFHARAKIEALQGNTDKALADLEKSIQLEPETIVFRVDLAKFQIRIGFVVDASAQLEKAREVAPFDQDVIAYQALCWRLLGDDREKALMDYDAFIGVYEIEVPEGYENLEQFNLALNKALDQFHLSAQQPSDQTLTGGGGTQSIAAILDHDVKEIQELRKSLQKAARRYISELPDDPEHPLLGRKADDYSFSGSFSIRLRDQGFHFNHTHPEGWISGCYYVSLPDVVKDGESQQGWIKFGESPLNLGEKEVIERIIQPQEGVVAFFPSYMFHGTIPFSSTQRRTTLPMDIIPTPDKEFALKSELDSLRSY